MLALSQVYQKVIALQMMLSRSDKQLKTQTLQPVNHVLPYFSPLHLISPSLCCTLHASAE